MGPIHSPSALTDAEASAESLAIGPILESEPLTEDEPASSVHSVSDELDAKTPTVTKKSTYPTAKPKHEQEEEEEDEDGSTEEEDDGEEDDGSTEEEDDGDEASEDEEDEEEEPALKYERIGKAAAEILEKDTASAIAVGETYFVSIHYHSSSL